MKFSRLHDALPGGRGTPANLATRCACVTASAGCQSGVQAGDRFRGGGEGGIAGCRVPALAGLDELNLMRVQTAHRSHGELTASRAGRVRLGYRFGGRV